MTKSRRKPSATKPSAAKPRGAAPRPAARREADRAWPLWLGAVLFLTFVAYLPSLDNDFTNWDDPLFVLENPLLPDPSLKAVLTTPVANNYHPLTIYSLVLNYRLSGLDPGSYHWLNLLLHLANTGLVFAFVRMLAPHRPWTAALTSLLFGIHPMHVESVAWIAERKDVLYVLFYLLGLIAYLRYLDRLHPPWLVATGLAYVLSLASKPSAVVFPLTLLAIDFCRRRPVRWRPALEKAPFLALAIPIGLLTVRAQQATGAIDPQHWGPSFQKVLFAAYGTLMYFVKFLAPINLSAVYPYPAPGESLGPYYLAFAITAIGLPALLYSLRGNRAVLFGIAFFFINIALVLQVFSVGHALMADRYTYLPYVGIAFALAWWLDEPAPRAPAGRAGRVLLTGALALLVPVSVVETWKRCDVWQNSGTLWNDAIDRYPGRIADAYCNRGLYNYQRDRRADAALADFDRAIALNPRMVDAWVSKGTVLAEGGQYDSALVCFERTLQLQPDNARAWNNRGGIKMRKGDLPGAVADLSRAVEINPGYRDGYSNRALAYMQVQDYEKSIPDNRRAIELAPQHPDRFVLHGSVGIALQRLGRQREAIAEFDTAIRLGPPGDRRLGAYHLYRSYAWRALGEPESARRDALEAQRLGARVDPAYLREIGI